MSDLYERINRLEAQNVQIIGVLQQAAEMSQQQQPNAPVTTTDGTNQPPANPMNPQLLQVLAPLLGSVMHEPDPWMDAMKAKALAGMDLSNKLTESFINAFALGKLKVQKE